MAPKGGLAVQLMAEAEAPPDVAHPSEAAGRSLLAADRLGMWAWVFGYTAILTLLSVLRYDLWLATGFDLGMYEQGLWLIWHRGLASPSSFTGHPLLGLSASYVLVPLALFYHLGGAGILLVLQSFCLGLGYVALRRIGKTLGVGDRAAHLLGVVYLLYPIVLGSNLFDFHPLTLAVPMLFAAAHAAIRHRPLACAAWLALALVTTDTLIVPILGMGAALLLQRRAGPGAAALAVAAAFALVDGLIVLPHLGGPPPGRTALLAAAGIPPDPASWLRWTHGLRGWEYLVWLAGPLLGLVVAGRRGTLNAWWLPALAVAAVNLATGTSAATSPFNQMTLGAVPFAFVASLAGLRRAASAPRAAWIAAPALAFLVIFTVHEARTDWHDVPHDVTQLDIEAARIPPQAGVVSQNFALAHLADRARAQLPAAVSGPLPGDTYVLLEPAVGDGVTPAAALNALTARLLPAAHAVVMYDKGGIILARVPAQPPAAPPS